MKIIDKKEINKKLIIEEINKNITIEELFNIDNIIFKEQLLLEWNIKINNESNYYIILIKTGDKIKPLFIRKKINDNISEQYDYSEELAGKMGIDIEEIKKEISAEERYSYHHEDLASQVLIELIEERLKEHYSKLDDWSRLRPQNEGEYENAICYPTRKTLVMVYEYVLDDYIPTHYSIELSTIQDIDDKDLDILIASLYLQKHL